MDALPGVVAESTSTPALEINACGSRTYITYTELTATTNLLKRSSGFVSQSDVSILLRDSADGKLVSVGQQDGLFLLQDVPGSLRTCVVALDYRYNVLWTFDASSGTMSMHHPLACRVSVLLTKRCSDR